MNINNIIFNTKYNLFRKNSIRFSQKLSAQQKMSESELEHLSWTKRKKILDYAFHFVPFYKEKYQSVGMHPKDIKTREDFEKIPILTKDDIKNNIDEMVSLEYNKNNLNIVSTGGSTGEPVSVYHDPNVKIDVFSWRMLEWWGVKPSDNTALIYRHIPKGINKFLNRIIWFPTKRCFLDASYMTNTSINKFLGDYARSDIKLILGYVGAINSLAIYIEKNNIKISPPKAIWTTSSPLPESQREFIQSVFRAPVYSQYGSCETFWLAAECGNQKGMHIFSDVRYLEFVNLKNRKVNNNEYGRILVTDLENYACPIIRYENGDRGKVADNKCDCGVNLPLMDTVKGRSSDSVIMPNGDVFSGEFLTTIFDDYVDQVKAFQIKQKKDFSIEILFVQNENIDDFTSLKIVREKFLKLCNYQVTCSLQRVNEIQHDRGKSKYVISEVKL